jgi:hypothetical protein
VSWRICRRWGEVDESFQYRVRFADGYLVEFVTGAVVDAEAMGRLLRSCEEGFGGASHVRVPVRSIMKLTFVKGAGDGGQAA